jgi:hypothetical protein
VADGEDGGHGECGGLGVWELGELYTGQQ